ncbi:MAG: LysR family transcriptional regulator [Acidobacteriota bacterium]
MELRHLRYFVAVAEELHFGHAAKRLSTSQPSLSQQIRNLEREIKVELLHRTQRSVKLTPAGDRFLQEARGILSAAERAAALAREAARSESRKVVLGISPDTDWLFLGRVLRLFAEHVPFVEVVFQNLTPEAQIEALRDGRIDVGFVGLPLEAEGLVTEKAARVRLMVALPEKHPMARLSPLYLEELANEAYMLWPRHLSPGSYDHLLAVFRAAGFGPPITMEGGIPSTRTVLGMTAAGLAIALVDPALQHVAAPGVIFRPLAGRGVFTETGVIYRRGDSSPILISFLQELRATARQTPAPSARIPLSGKKPTGKGSSGKKKKAAARGGARKRKPGRR